MCLGGYIHVSVGAHRGQQYQILLELKFQEVEVPRSCELPWCGYLELNSNLLEEWYAFSTTEPVICTFNHWTPPPVFRIFILYSAFAKYSTVGLLALPAAHLAPIKKYPSTAVSTASLDHSLLSWRPCNGLGYLIVYHYLLYSSLLLSTTAHINFSPISACCPYASLAPNGILWFFIVLHSHTGSQPFPLLTGLNHFHCLLTLNSPSHFSLFLCSWYWSLGSSEHKVRKLLFTLNLLEPFWFPYSQENIVPSSLDLISLLLSALNSSFSSILYTSVWRQKKGGAR